MELLRQYQGWIIALLVVAAAALWLWKPWVKPHEASAGEAYAVVDIMDGWYALDGAPKRPSDEQIIADADESCEDFREFGMLNWHSLGISVARADNDPGEFDDAWEYPYRYQYQAFAIAETGYCPEAADAYGQWEDYLEQEDASS